MNKKLMLLCCILASGDLYAAAMDEYNQSFAQSEGVVDIFHNEHDGLEHTSITSEKWLLKALLSNAEQRPAEKNFTPLHQLIHDTDDSYVTVSSQHIKLMEDVFAAVAWNGKVRSKDYEVSINETTILLHGKEYEVLLNDKETLLHICGGKTKSIPVGTVIQLDALQGN